MYLFAIAAKVNPKSKLAKEFREVGGAFVNCYISFKNYQAAEKLARLLIRENGWIPMKETNAYKLTRSRLKTKKDRQYYSEALRDGYCLVFHTWPRRRGQALANNGDIRETKAQPQD